MRSVTRVRCCRLLVFSSVLFSFLSCGNSAIISVWGFFFLEFRTRRARNWGWSFFWLVVCFFVLGFVVWGVFLCC